LERPGAGTLDEARLALEESVTLGIAVGDRYGLGFAYRGLGLIAQAQGKHFEAVDLLVFPFQPVAITSSCRME
jgi:hypothetical protein